MASNIAFNPASLTPKTICMRLTLSLCLYRPASASAEVVATLGGPEGTYCLKDRTNAQRAHRR